MDARVVVGLKEQTSILVQGSSALAQTDRQFGKVRLVDGCGE